MIRDRAFMRIAREVPQCRFCPWPNRRHKNFGGLLRVDSVQELLPHFGLDFFWEGWWTVLFRWAV